MTQRSMSVRVRSSGPGQCDSTAQSSLRGPPRLKAPGKALPPKQPLHKRREAQAQPSRASVKSPGNKRLAAYHAMTSAPSAAFLLYLWRQMQRLQGVGAGVSRQHCCRGCPGRPCFAGTADWQGWHASSWRCQQPHAHVGIAGQQGHSGRWSATASLAWTSSHSYACDAVACSIKWDYATATHSQLYTHLAVCAGTAMLSPILSPDTKRALRAKAVPDTPEGKYAPRCSVWLP